MIEFEPDDEALGRLHTRSNRYRGHHGKQAVRESIGLRNGHTCSLATDDTSIPCGANTDSLRGFLGWCSQIEIVAFELEDELLRGVH